MYLRERQQVPQYDDKKKLTETIDGPRLFMKSVNTQTLPIPCTCADSENDCKFVGSGKSYMASIFLHFLWQCAYTWKYFKLLFLRSLGIM